MPSNCLSCWTSSRRGSSVFSASVSLGPEEGFQSGGSVRGVVLAGKFRAKTPKALREAGMYLVRIVLIMNVGKSMHTSFGIGLVGHDEKHQRGEKKMRKKGQVDRKDRTRVTTHYQIQKDRR